jgi:hypothetical protein
VRIVGFEFTGKGSMVVTFGDGARCQVVFASGQVTGLAARVAEQGEFALARLRGGSVEWPCGYRLDADVGRIRADEARPWIPK